MVAMKQISHWVRVSFGQNRKQRQRSWRWVMSGLGLKNKVIVRGRMKFLPAVSPEIGLLCCGSFVLLRAHAAFCNNYRDRPG